LSLLLGELKSDKPDEVSPAAAPRPETQDGLAVDVLTPKLRQRLKLPASVTQGIVVTGVAPGSPASEGGLQPGDVIIELDRKPVSNVQEFRAAYKQPNAKRVLLLIYREGRTHYLVLNR
jgi:serine protease Do